MGNREVEKAQRIEALRSRAENVLRLKGANSASDTPDMYTMQGLMHELHVGQVELEMQNEELLESRAAIEKSLNEYATIYEFAPVAYFTLDRYGVILKANIAASRLTGHTNKVLVKRPFRSLLIPGRASAFYDYVNNIFKTDTKQVSEFEITSKDGNILFVYMEAQSLYEQNKPSQCLLALIDVTAQREAENKLQQEKAFSESLLENSIDGIVAFDKESRIISWNRVMEELTGKSKAEVMGKNIFKLFPAYQVNEEGKAIRKALQGETTVLHDHPYGIRNGFYEVYTLPLFINEQHLREKEVRGGLSIIHDVTERIKLEQERITLKLNGQKELLNAILQAQKEERKRIAESLHNGVGQILYAAKLNIEQICIQEGQSGAAQLKSAKQQASKLLEEAIRETRSVSHELVPVILQDFGLEEAIYDLTKKYTGNHFSLKTEIFGFDQRLDKYVEIALYRMAQELLNNTVKHAQASKVKLQLVRGEGRIVLKVTDNGKGFEVDKKYRGMGLRSIKDRVELLNGTIQIKSEINKETFVLIIIPDFS